MSESKDSVTPDHFELVESINRRCNVIYKQLREYEESLEACNFDGGDTTKLMDLIETITTIQEAAQIIQPHNLELRSRQQALEEQMKCIEQSVDLLKLYCGESKN